MRFASIGSGSRGNATLVEQGDTLLMIDCGFSCAEVERRLPALDKRAEQVSAIVVTHEHSDHISGVARLARKYDIPVWMTPGTSRMHKGGDIPRLDCFNSHTPFRIGDLEVRPFPVPHDACEPCQFVFSGGDRQLGVLTDTGSLTEHIVRSLEGCDALLLECNHDPDMLARGPYPPSLQQRVGGRFGHLSNGQAADLLARIDSARLEHLVIAHISEKNNHPDLARDALAEAAELDGDWICIADQEAGFGWRSL